MVPDILPLLRAGVQPVLDAPEAVPWVAGWLLAAVAMRLHSQAAPDSAAVEEALLAALAPV